jgi:hypothetical protein
MVRNHLSCEQNCLHIESYWTSGLIDKINSSWKKERERIITHQNDDLKSDQKRKNGSTVSFKIDVASILFSRQYRLLWSELHFLRQLGQYRKLARAWNWTILTKISFPKTVKHTVCTSFISGERKKFHFKYFFSKPCSMIDVVFFYGWLTKIEEMFFESTTYIQY